MNIILKDRVNLHWWGNQILLVYNLSDYYILTDEEKYLIEKLQKSNDIETVTQLISKETDLLQNVVKNFIDIFLGNYSNFFSISSISSLITISGQKDMYYPLEMHISLTNKCMQQCIHCYKSANKNGVFIHYKHLITFLDRMQGYTPYLSLSGGEPTLHPNFSDIIDRYNNIYNISIMTSGYKIPHSLYTSFLKAKRGISLSIYSSNSNIHDSFANTKYSYDEIMHTIFYSLKLNIPVSVSTLLTNNNSSDIIKLINDLSNIGIKNISIGSIAPLGRAIDNSIKALNSIPIELIHFIKTHENINILVDICNKKVEYVDQKYLSPFKCFAGSLIWSIYETGEIQPCAIKSYNELKLGQIDNFDDYILSDRTSYIKRISQMPLIKRLNLPNIYCPFN